jgi:transcription-repair coupling factor (superfamily II helicase)
VIFKLSGEPDDAIVTPASAARLAVELSAQGHTVIVCGDASVARLREVLARRSRIDADRIVPFADWNAAAGSPPGQIGVLSVALRYGFRLPGLNVIAMQMSRAGAAAPDPLEHLSGTLSIGDLVVESERGLAQLAGLVTEHQAGKSFECLALLFRDDTRLLVPATEAGRVWRYGVGGAVRCGPTGLTARRGGNRATVPRQKSGPPRQGWSNARANARRARPRSSSRPTPTGGLRDSCLSF